MDNEELKKNLDKTTLEDDGLGTTTSDNKEIRFNQ